MRRARRLRPNPLLHDVVDAWLGHLATAQHAPATLAAYRRDIDGVASRIAASDADAVGRRLRVQDLDKRALRVGFASWAADHAPASVLRAHSAWSSFFDFLVGEDLREGNPMSAVTKPRRPNDAPRAIGHPDAASRLLATAAVADPRARAPWPERDLALIATFCVSGIRVGEAVSLAVSSLNGPADSRHLTIMGSGGRSRAIAVHDPLASALETYIVTRKARFPEHDLESPTTALFVDARGQRLSADQIKYLIERLYVRAGLRARVPPGALVHALRHTFAMSALQAGTDIITLGALLGHSSLETTRRYVDHLLPAASAGSD